MPPMPPSAHRNSPPIPIIKESLSNKKKSQSIASSKQRYLLENASNVRKARTDGINNSKPLKEKSGNKSSTLVSNQTEVSSSSEKKKENDGNNNGILHNGVGMGDGINNTMGMYSPYSAGTGMGMGGMGMGGMGMGGMGMGGMGMGMGGMMGGMGMGNVGMGGPISSLNNFLFGFQSVVFSLGQAMNIVGMNTQALKQLYSQIMSMMDSALSTLEEIRVMEQTMSRMKEEHISEDDKKRRRRLKALRWSLVMGASYMGYRIVSRWLRRRREFQGWLERKNVNQNPRFDVTSRNIEGNHHNVELPSPNQYNMENRPSYPDYNNGNNRYRYDNGSGHSHLNTQYGLSLSNGYERRPPSYY